MSPDAASPFHAGERAAQARAGVAERMAEIGPRVIRAAMPAQHRLFFAQLPFLALAADDAAGALHATLLAGAAPGFVQSPNDTTLRIAALPPEHDPLHRALAVSAQVGLLGIELPTRRRNRANGVVASHDDHGFELRVTQSFGNCPKYIHLREPAGAEPLPPLAPTRAARLDARMQALVRAADTFFIASRAGSRSPSAGHDVSHRGGPPGFVETDAAGTLLTWPDYLGNFFFNTLGNLVASPEAALVLPGFETGDLLHVRGRAHIVWEGAELARFAGAQRLVRLEVEEALLRPRALRLRWNAVRE